MSTLQALFTLVVAASLAAALKLPNYTKACKRNDPNLDECVVKNGQTAISVIINGDPKYRVPKLEPMEITELIVSQGTKQVGLKLTLKNVKIYGMKNAKFVKAKTDLEKRHVEWFFKNPRLEISSDYDVSGQILILPIIGTGKANITLTNMDISYKYDWELVKRQGRDYMNLTSSHLLFEIGRAFFDVKNLFNGDEFLGNNMNTFLNENWKEVTKELGPAMGQAFSEVFRNLLTSVVAQVPYDEIYI